MDNTEDSGEDENNDFIKEFNNDYNDTDINIGNKRKYSPSPIIIQKNKRTSIQVNKQNNKH